MTFNHLAREDLTTRGGEGRKVEELSAAQRPGAAGGKSKQGEPGARLNSLPEEIKRAPGSPYLLSVAGFPCYGQSARRPRKSKARGSPEACLDKQVPSRCLFGFTLTAP